MCNPRLRPQLLRKLKFRCFSSKRRTCDRINKLTNSLALRNGVNPGVIQGMWTHQLKGKSNQEASLADLQRKLDWLSAKLEQQDWL